jgi:beta-galactosidase
VTVENGVLLTARPLPEVAISGEPARLAAVIDGPLVAENTSGKKVVAADTGRYATAFAYSGPAAGVRIERDGARNGKRVYTDLDEPYRDLPEALIGADVVQTADADRMYRAVDLMEIGVKAGSVVWVVHDDRLPRPIWLTGQFMHTDLSLTVAGQRMTIFERKVQRDESLTLGSNYDGRPRAGNMYFVLVKMP